MPVGRPGPPAWPATSDALPSRRLAGAGGAV